MNDRSKEILQDLSKPCKETLQPNKQEVRTKYE